MEMFVFSFLAIVFLAISIFFRIWKTTRYNQIAQNWAKKEKLEILTSEHKYWNRGPFFKTTSKGQSILYVETSDKKGNIRKGHLLCGGFWGGVLQNKATIKWKEQPQP